MKKIRSIYVLNHIRMVRVQLRVHISHSSSSSFVAEMYTKRMFGIYHGTYVVLVAVLSRRCIIAWIHKDGGQRRRSHAIVNFKFDYNIELGLSPYNCTD